MLNEATGKRYTKAELVAMILPHRSSNELVWRQYLRRTYAELSAKASKKVAS